MAGTKSRSFAVLMTVLMIVVAIYMGGLRSLTKARAKALDLFAVSTQTDGVQTELGARVATARNLTTVAKKYLPADSMAIQDVLADATALEVSIGAGQSGAPNKKLAESTAKLIALLQGESLSTDDSRYVLEFETKLASSQKAIEKDPYNEAAKQFNASIRRFPANILSPLTGTKPLEVFGE